MIACASVSGGVIFIPKQLHIKRTKIASNDNGGADQALKS